MALGLQMMAKSLFPDIDFSTPETLLRTALPGFDIVQTQADLRRALITIEQFKQQQNELFFMVKQLYDARPDPAATGPAGTSGPLSIGTGSSGGGAGAYTAGAGAE
jgi:hypothetical protein